jgi:hypothetical protein
MRIRSLLAAGVAALTVGTFVTAQPAEARPSDRGRNGADCVSGEICFNYAPGSSTAYRHFFYDADHRGDYFDGVGYRLSDNIAGYRNLDTQCTVYVWDITSTGRWYVYSTIGKEYPAVTRTRTYRTYSPGDRNRNNGHTRCQGATAPIGR